MNAPLSPELARKMDAWWRAANYLSVGQIYLLDNPLLREPLRIEQEEQGRHSRTTRQSTPDPGRASMPVRVTVKTPKSTM